LKDWNNEYDVDKEAVVCTAASFWCGKKLYQENPVDKAAWLCI
jgi:hypothetical protein